MVLLASPSSVGLPQGENPWIACRHLWNGWDGSEWDLSHGLSGLALQAGTRGMRNPPLQRYATKSPAVAGSLFRGVVADERDCFWPLNVFSHSGSIDWIDHNAAFWRTLDPEQTGLWTVVQASGAKRSLRVRYTGLADDSDDIDPSLVGWAMYGVNLIAEQPYWTGEPVGASFFNQSENAPTGSYVVWIKSSFTLGQAAVENKGDVPAWPIWTIHGPCTTVTVGLDGHAITFPISLGSGQWVRIDTDPSDQVVIDQSGADRSAQLTAVDFAAIPPGANVPLSISMSGFGSVDVSIVPRYYRAM